VKNPISKRKKMAEILQDTDNQNPNIDPDTKDWGFGNSFERQRQRLVNRDGTFNVVRKGASFMDFHLYHYLIRISWPRFWLILVAFYIAFNSFFAMMYMLIGVENLQGTPVQSGTFAHFLHAFYFSAQTFTTVGYGAISPMGNPANLVASFEAMTGLVGFAFATGLLYGRFSLPKAHIRFSEKALFAPYQGGKGFMFRIVNGRNNQLIELNAQLLMNWYNHRTGKREFALLELERAQVSLFPLSWTIVHPIDEQSPMHLWTEADLRRNDPEFLIIIRGFDDTFAQDVHAMSSYKQQECVWGGKFNKMFHPDEDGEGNTVIHLDQLSDYEEVGI
jgi:inward rectifier potassium channel